MAIFKEGNSITNFQSLIHGNSATTSGTTEPEEVTEKIKLDLVIDESKPDRFIAGKPESKKLTEQPPRKPSKIFRWE